MLGLFTYRHDPRPCLHPFCSLCVRPRSVCTLLLWGSTYCCFSLVFFFSCVWEIGLLFSFENTSMLHVVSHYWWCWSRLADGVWAAALRDWPSPSEQYWCDLDGTREDCPFGLGHALFCNDVRSKLLSFVTLIVGHTSSQWDSWNFGYEWSLSCALQGKAVSMESTLITLVSLLQEATPRALELHLHSVFVLVKQFLTTPVYFEKGRVGGSWLGWLRRWRGSCWLLVWSVWTFQSR